jgi:hypothetical protein
METLSMVELIAGRPAQDHSFMRILSCAVYPVFAATTSPMLLKIWTGHMINPARSFLNRHLG